MTVPLVSVVVCSRDGADRLPQTLASIERALHGREDAEVIVVDSASRDTTFEVANRHPVRPTVLRLELPGVSRAKNAATTSARGKVILFTDDDVHVPENWVDAMLRPFEDPPCMAVAGTTYCPAASDLGGFARQLLADTVSLGDPPRTLIGASCGIRSTVFGAGLRFCEALGPGALGFMEESLLHLQLSEVGATVRAVRDAPVRHDIDRARLRPQYLRKRAWLQGRCEAWIVYHWLHQKHLTGQTVGVLRNLRHYRRHEEPDLELVRNVGSLTGYARQLGHPRWYPKRFVPNELRDLVAAATVAN